MNIKNRRKSTSLDNIRTDIIVPVNDYLIRHFVEIITTSVDMCKFSDQKMITYVLYNYIQREIEPILTIKDQFPCYVFYQSNLERHISISIVLYITTVIKNSGSMVGTVALDLSQFK